MKRKVVNPDPQQKKTKKIEEKIQDKEMKDQIINIEESLEKKNKEI